MAVIEAAKRLLIAMGHGAEQRRVIQLGDIVAHTPGSFNYCHSFLVAATGAYGSLRPTTMSTAGHAASITEM